MGAEHDADRESIRRDALTSFLEQKVAAGYEIETRTDTHAIIAPLTRTLSFLDRFRRSGGERLVVSVDEHGVVSTTPAEPLRS